MHYLIFLLTYFAPIVLFLLSLYFFFIFFLSPFLPPFPSLLFLILRVDPPSPFLHSFFTLLFICLEQIFKSINPLQQRDCVKEASEPADVVGPGFQ